MNTVTIQVPDQVPAPRGAAWAARAAATLSRAITRWTAPRAPVCAATVEAAQVRALARSYLNSDPGFAADLFAAANRHESTGSRR